MAFHRLPTLDLKNERSPNMSMSESGPSYGSDIYYYFVEKRVKGKKKNVKVRVRLSEKEGNYWHVQRVRDGYTSSTNDISKFIKE